MPRKVFTPGEVLAAADVNSFLMDQTIMTFAGTAARGSAIGTATEGMYAHLNDTDTLTYYNGSAWVNRIAASAGILQVVSTTKTDTFTANVNQAANTAITGLSATITPSSTSSKILVQASISVGAAISGFTVSSFFYLFRGATQIGLGDANGNRQRITSGSDVSNTQRLGTVPILFLDSPATTSATTYSVNIAHGLAGTAAVYVNRNDDDPNLNYIPAAVSTITLMEVAS
jgi:hypothetical protein